MDYTEYGVPQQVPTNNNRTRKILLVVCAFAVIAAAAILITSTKAKQSTTLLKVTVNDPSAQVTALRSGKEPKNLGKGSVEVRLEPGSYTIDAKTQNAETTKSVSVDANQETAVTLSLTDAQSPKAVAQYSAQDIYVKGQTLYFLNLPFHLINSFTPGDYRVVPFAPDAYPLNRVYWLNDQQQYAQNTSNLWYYIDHQKIAPVLEKSDMLDFSNISFNRNGAFAYISNDKQVIYRSAPNAKPISITTNVSPDAKVSLADNGNILVYTPKQNYQAKVTDTELYQAASNKLTSLGSDLTGIDNVVWSPQGSAFAYSASGGLYDYRISEAAKQQIIATAPDTPASLTWISPTRLLFAQAGNIWDYKTDEESSSKLCSITGILNTDFQTFYVDSGTNTAYFGTIPNGGQGGSIYDVPLSQ